jgi:hypothetical protein
MLHVFYKSNQMQMNTQNLISASRMIVKNLACKGKAIRNSVLKKKYREDK